MKVRSNWTIFEGRVFEGLVALTALRGRRQYHCGKCGQRGHNARVCGRREPVRRRKPAVRPPA
jgi:hypothetical protein